MPGQAQSLTSERKSLATASATAVARLRHLRSGEFPSSCSWCKNFRGVIGPVSRKKQAPKEYPVEPGLREILLAHHAMLKDEEKKRLEDEGVEIPHPSAPLKNPLMFPSKVGTLRTPNSMDRSWAKCLELAGITKRFTVHGLRYTFTDLVRRANVDAVVRRALTGHVTEEMQQHYSSVGIDEKRAAIAGVLRLVPPAANDVVIDPQASGTGS